MNIYITKEGQRTGPFTLPQINAFINIGRLNENDYAWHEGCPAWIRVKDVHGVRLHSSKKEPLKQATKPRLIRPEPRTSNPRREPLKTSRTSFRKRVICRICEAGELAKSVLPRFSGSLSLLGYFLLVMGISSLGVLILAATPLEFFRSDTSPVTIVINGSQLLHVDSNQWVKFIAASRRMILSQWQFLLLTSFSSIILYSILQSKKQVLQCSHCESVVPIE